jgi:hypothetical protein
MGLPIETRPMSISVNSFYFAVITDGTYITHNIKLKMQDLLFVVRCSLFVARCSFFIPVFFPQGSNE